MVLYRLKEKIILVVLLIPLFNCSSIAETKAPNFYSVAWDTQTTEVRLPEPFNRVTIKVSKSGEKLDGVTLLFGENKVQFSKQLLDGIVEISDPEFSYDRADFDKDQKINSFDIYFEYGYPKIISESPCVDSARDIVAFTVDKDYKISRKFIVMNLGE